MSSWFQDLGSFSAVPCFRIWGHFPPFRQSTIPPFYHSTILPFYHSTIPPFHHSTIPPFQLLGSPCCATRHYPESFDGALYRLCTVLQMSAKLFAIEQVHFTISCFNSTWSTRPFIIWLNYPCLGCSVSRRKTKPSRIWPLMWSVTCRRSKDLKIISECHTNQLLISRPLLVSSKERLLRQFVICFPY